MSQKLCQGFPRGFLGPRHSGQPPTQTASPSCMSRSILGRHTETRACHASWDGACGTLFPLTQPPSFICRKAQFCLFLKYPFSGFADDNQTPRKGWMARAPSPVAAPEARRTVVSRKGLWSSEGLRQGRAMSKGPELEPAPGPKVLPHWTSVFLGTKRGLSPNPGT